MKRKLVLLYGLLLSLMLFTSAMSHSQENEGKNVRNITMNDGLPTNAVRCIVQDKQGFIWFGTDNGLCRYDGYGVQTFTIPLNKYDQFISTLNVLDDGLLVGTAKGAYIFSFRTEQFTLLSDKITSQINSFAQDGDGNIWISTREQGIFRYNHRNQNCKNYPFSQLKGYVALVFVDANNQVWAMSNLVSAGPYRLNKSTDKFERVALKSSFPLTGMSMLQMNDGTLLVGTWEDGLVKLNGDGSIEQLINPSITNVAHHIHCLFKASPTEILVGSDDGLLVYDIQQKSWRQISELNDPLKSITERFVYSIAKDNEGGLWIGTFYGGVSYFSPLGERFHTYMNASDPSGLHGNVVGRFCEDAQHRIWIATDDGGVNCYDAANDRFLDYPGKQVLSKYNVHGLFVDNGSLWIGTYGNGIIKTNLTTGALQTYNFAENQTNSSCYCIFRDSKHRLWGTSMEGVYILDESSDQFKPVKSFKALRIGRVTCGLLPRDRDFGVCHPQHLWVLCRLQKYGSNT